MEEQPKPLPGEQAAPEAPGGEEEEEKKSRPADNLELKLLDSRTILVEGVVGDKMMRAFSTRLLYLEQKDPVAEVVVLINSPGGAADTGFALYDLMRFVRCPITTICAGLCASAAVLIYLGGRKGRRFAFPNARFLMHQPSTAAYGPASDMEITAKEIIRARHRYAEIIAHEIGSQTEKVIEDSNRDFWLDSEQSVKYGLVDRIVTTRQEMGT